MKPFSSAVYWESRYRDGGNSGAGSYNELGQFKAEVLNSAIIEYKINQVIEFGCGDGAILSLLEIKTYIGLDVSTTIIQQCISKFKSDKTKSFFIYDSKSFADNQHIFKFDAAFSIDVIFHLVEYVIFEKYLEDLFSSALKLVVIYGADLDYKPKTEHELYRKFTMYIEKKFPDWKLVKIIKNRYPLRDNIDQNGSLSDFFFYVRK